jgi:hypothetical protein
MEGADFRLSGKYPAMEALSSLRSDILHQVGECFVSSTCIVCTVFHSVFPYGFLRDFSRYRYLTICKFLRRCSVWYLYFTHVQYRYTEPTKYCFFLFMLKFSLRLLETATVLYL